MDIDQKHLKGSKGDFFSIVGSSLTFLPSAIVCVWKAKTCSATTWGESSSVFLMNKKMLSRMSAQLKITFLLFSMQCCCVLGVENNFLLLWFVAFHFIQKQSKCWEELNMKNFAMAYFVLMIFIEEKVLTHLALILVWIAGANMNVLSLWWKCRVLNCEMAFCEMC